ncbi:MAG: phospho-sugar mutase, partial [Sciscionella sp.]|nr:phospho-sugar mutase [Sciscionella sp.]
MSLSPQLRDAAFRWIVDDFDDDSKQELQMVVGSAMAGNDDAVAELSDRMNGSLTFGTAGLRGIVRAGPNGMNRAVVARTTFAVASWLTANGHGGGIVIVGRDARHGSEVFATDVAEVLAALGFDVRAFADPLPTPLVPFAVRQLSAVAGIQITASHNPPADNGYKLYDNSGAQIIAPADREIEAAIRQAPAARNIGRTRGWREIDESVVDDYLSRIGKIHTGESRKLRIALTPMHGVGGEIAVKALRVAGFTDVHVVREQAAPDPEFPTVSFPNPEEPGATDLLLALAGKVGADLAIALDPDADRCAIGIPTGDGWRMLRGDETGALLGDYLLSTLDTSAHPDPLVATTIVSSTMLKSIAAKHGARYAETLTGFKWLVRAGDGLVFAYEEALG